jgi:hypothetical protein
MKHFICLATVLMAATSTGMARAEQQETRNCEFTVKKPRVSGQASVTLIDGKVTKIAVDVLYSDGLGTPGYTCTVDSSRADDQESKWSEDGGATVIDNVTPFDISKPDRIKATAGKFVSIDMEDTQSLGRCGVGAALPKAIVIPAKGTVCRVWLREP